MLTNATRVVKTSKLAYTAVSYVAEAIEDASQVPVLRLDIAFFGQPIPENTPGKFSNWSNMTD